MGLIKGDTRSLDYSSCRPIPAGWHVPLLEKATPQHLQLRVSSSGTGLKGCGPASEKGR